MAGARRRKSAKRVAKAKEDRISQLPSEVLTHILSFLLMKEAARTSVLSKGWRRHWLLVDEFDFDAEEVFGYIEWDRQSAEMGRFAEWISSVLHSHRVATLEIDDDDTALVIKKLRIVMMLTNVFQEDLEEWIAYALARRVKCLELRLNNYVNRCCFPGRLVESNFDCLKSLSLVRLDVTGEDIESILRRFSSLEHLKVRGSNALRRVQVCGSSLALKHLEILTCVNMEYAIVRNTNLVSIMITLLSKVVLENNPKLVDVCAVGWGMHLSPTESRLKPLFGCFSRVESLTLDITYYDDGEVMDEVPQLIELKQLTLIVIPDPKALVRLTTLLSLSPKLEKLVLEFGGLCMFVRQVRDYEEIIKSCRGPKLPLQHLKAVEVRSYIGDVAEDGILMYLFAHALAPIERVTFDPDNLRRNLPTRPLRIWTQVTVEKRAGKLRRVIPSSIELTVIELP